MVKHAILPGHLPVESINNFGRRRINKSEKSRAMRVCYPYCVGVYFYLLLPTIPSTELRAIFRREKYHLEINEIVLQ